MSKYQVWLQQRQKSDFLAQAKIRKVVSLDGTMHSFIKQLHYETIGIRQALNEKEEQIKREKERKLLEQKCSHLINTKFQIPKKAVFKRQNSFNN